MEELSLCRIHSSHNTFKKKERLLSCSHVGPYILFSRKFREKSIAKGCDVFRSVRADMNKHAKCVHSTKGTFWHRNRLPFVFGSPSTHASSTVRVNVVASVMLLFNIMLLTIIILKLFQRVLWLFYWKFYGVSVITDWKRHKKHKLRILSYCQNYGLKKFVVFL